MQHRQKLLLFAVVVSLIGLVGLAAVLPIGADDGSPGFPGAETISEEHNASHPSVEHGLLDDADDDTVTPQTVDPSGDEITVVVEASPGQANAAEDAVAETGDVELRHESLIQATLPREAVEELADDSAVAFVRAPLEPEQQHDYSSEGVEVIGADLEQQRDRTGEDITVAVIDHGFDPDPYHDPIADNVVHTESFVSGAGIDGGLLNTRHGDGSAEIVVDTAPDTDLVLIAAQTGVEMLNAIDWIDNNEEVDIDAVSMSLGFPGGLPNDGTSVFDQEIDKSVTSGTPWFVSSGNEADREHWNGTFNPTEDGLHEFEGESVVSPVVLDQGASITLQWDDWDDTDQDYSLSLWNETDPITVSNSNQADGSAGPVESIDFSQDPYNDAGDTYAIVIAEDEADGDADFDMFVSRGTLLDYWTEARSITMPATGKEVTAVGAIDQFDEELQPYSSRGPTIDGRTKPELTAPDNVTSEAYDPSTYPGTSAAAPHAAGAAALLMGADDSLDADGVNDRLTQTADTVDASTPNNDVGWGLVNIEQATPPQDPDSTAATDISSGNADDVAVDVTFQERPEDGQVEVRLTDESGTAVTAQESLATDDTTTTVTLDASTLDDGDITVEATTHDTTNYQNVDGYTAESTVTKDTDESGDFEVSIDAPDEPVTEGETLDVNTTIEETTSDVAEDVTVTLTVDSPADESVYDETIDIGTLGGEQTVTFGDDGGTEAVGPLEEEGDYTATVDVDADNASPVTATESFTVSSDGDEEPSLDDYTDEDGNAEPSDVFAAIEDWRNDIIEPSLIFDVIDAWRN